MIRITDDKKFKTVKVTVDWMLNNIKSNFIDLDGNGFRIKGSLNKTKSIIRSIETIGFIPKPIVVGISGSFADTNLDETKDFKLIDGETRLQALKLVKEKYPFEYDQSIKDVIVDMIVLEDVSDDGLPPLYINLNKTRLDKSDTVALYLTHKSKSKFKVNVDRKIEIGLVLAVIDLGNSDQLMTIHRNTDGRIKLDKYPHLFDFIKVIYPLIKVMSDKNLIKCKDNPTEYRLFLFNFLSELWKSVYSVYNELFTYEMINFYKPGGSRSIINDQTGHKIIFKYLYKKLKEAKDIEDLDEFVYSTIRSLRYDIKITEKDWYIDGRIGRYRNCGARGVNLVINAYFKDEGDI